MAQLGFMLRDRRGAEIVLVKKRDLLKPADDEVMDHSSSLCWEGVALGWQEALPRPRSRGGVGVLSQKAPDNLSKLDSGLNSLEYWDYSVELECLSGPEGDESHIMNSKIYLYHTGT